MVCLALMNNKRPFQLSGRFLLFFLFMSLYVFLELIMLVAFGSSIVGFLSGGLALIAVCSTYIVFSQNRNTLRKSLYTVILLHLFFFYIQVFFWVLTDYYIDFVDIISDDYSVYSSAKGFYLFERRVPRFTGLFNEPGTYCKWLFAIVAIYHLESPKLNFLKLSAVISMFLSMSLFGWILGLSILVLTFLNSSRRILILGILVIVGNTTLLLIILRKRIEAGFLELDYRLQAIENIFTLPVLAYGRASGISCGSGVDVTVATTLICDGGFVYGLVFLMIMLVANAFGSVSSVLLTVLLLLSKIKLYYPLFWLFFTLLILVNRDRTKKTS